jgi:DNA-binding GntR family transcriptional regulator
MQGQRKPLKKSQGKKLFSDKAYGLLRKMILDLKMSPKEPISELKLSATLCMSRTPVREALKRLKTEGLIISYGNKGYVLNIPTMKEIKDIYAVRMVLEGGAAKSAAQNIDLDRLEYFEKQFISIKNSLNGKNEEGNMTTEASNDSKGLRREKEIIKLGRDFHLFIVESTENEKLLELIRNIYSQLDLSRFFSYQGRGKEAVNEHLRIINALRERNGEESRLLIEDHLKNAFDMITKIL